MIFKTERLFTRELIEADANLFFDMMGNPNVMNPVPAKVMNRLESDASLMDFISNEYSDKTVRAIILKDSNEFIGLCALLKNDENEDEIGYRLREKFWGLGFGTEITKGMFNYVFDILNLDLITADVDLTNKRSIKILEKFMIPTKEFKCETGGMDRRYELLKKDWKS